MTSSVWATDSTSQNDDLCLLCPAARVIRVDGELLSWYGSRAVAGLRYLDTLADDDNAAPRSPA